jgi:hypothetical protein
LEILTGKTKIVMLLFKVRVENMLTLNAFPGVIRDFKSLNNLSAGNLLTINKHGTPSFNASLLDSVYYFLKALSLLFKT